MDDALHAIERAAIAEELASVLRHDLRNKLASIRNAAFFIRRRTCDSDPWRSDPRLEQLFQLILDELAAASAALDQRTALAHLFGKQTAPIRLEDCVARALQNRSIPPGIRVQRHLDAACPIVTDPLELALLARCLLDNAVEAMPAEGLLVVRMFETDTTVSLAVEDSGCGFSAEQIAGYSQPFQTTKPGHAGLGLCIVRRIASRYGATVTLQPRAAQSLPPGAIVTVAFPRATAQSAPRQPAPEETAP